MHTNASPGDCFDNFEYIIVINLYALFNLYNHYTFVRIVLMRLYTLLNCCQS